ncbi:Glutaredoxin domain-containing cysteine-rich protein [Trichoplax sp. H2]|nr:Glutaredoxin domain-containing cysteine-rich protein [Trichoplax sp. H2]|eukprot:RDD40110.1 Glutaredoxin domain-containing cysteine-rich protein [Trichoplax sp. H2]
MSTQEIDSSELPKVRQLVNQFLSISITHQKNNSIDDKNEIVIYTTSIGIIRETAQDCQLVRSILQTLCLKFIEKDVSIHPLYLKELYERIGTVKIKLPQTFVGGLYVGGASAVESLNESGKLRELTTNFERQGATEINCASCYDYRFVPCHSCHGSRRNRSSSFNRIAELKCGQCNENGLQLCPQCSIPMRSRANSAPKRQFESEKHYNLQVPCTNYTLKLS